MKQKLVIHAIINAAIWFFLVKSVLTFKEFGSVDLKFTSAMHLEAKIWIGLLGMAMLVGAFLFMIALADANNSWED